MYELDNQPRREAESHDFVAAANASHQQAGKHDAHYLEGTGQALGYDYKKKKPPVSEG